MDDERRTGGRPGFDVAVAPGGYAWWYVDAAADDGEHLLTLILFVGNPFSPFYARALRGSGGATPADEHCATNVVLYRRRRKLWTFTEWRHAAVSRDRDGLRLGSSAMAWVGDALEVRFEQQSPLLGATLAGVVRLHPEQLFDHGQPLDGVGRHVWWPVAPLARVTVELTHPALRFTGTAYHDINHGAEPLAAGFQRWDWSHADVAGGAAVLYEGVRRDGAPFHVGHLFRRDGSVAPLDAPRAVRLARTRWGFARRTRTDADGEARVLQTLESAPFYARSRLATTLAGERVTALHETIELARFRRWWVRPLFYLRMRRGVSWSDAPRLGLLARLRP